MDMSEEQVLPASREVVWAMLNDPDVLRDCIPGCEELEMTSPNAYAATVQLKVGPVKARFKGEVELVDLVQPESFTIVGEGKGGVAGFAKGRANILLEPHAEGTLLKYDVEVKIGGKLAQLGNRMIDSTARRLAGQFFDCFAQKARAAEADAAH